MNSSKVVTPVDERASPLPPPKSSGTSHYFRTDHLRTNLGGRTVRGGILAVGTQALKFFITIGATSIMARLLSPQDYGLIGMVAFVTAFVSTYKDLGLSAATIQKAEITFEQISTLFWINLALSAAVTLFTIAISPLVSWFYGESRLTAITVVTAFGFLISGLAVQHEALLRRQMRYLSLSLIGLISLVLGYLVGIIIALRGFRYWALVGSQLTVATSTTVMTLLACRWIPGRPRRNTGSRSMIRFGGNLTGFATINFFSRNLDNLLIGRVWGAQQLGIYTRAYQLMMLPIDQINEPLNSVAVPALSRLMNDEESYRLAYLRMLEKLALVTMPLIALLIVTSDWIVAIVLGSQWRDVAPLLMILGVGGLIQPISNTTGWLFITQGRAKEMFKVAMIGGPMTIASIIAGLPWGAKGVSLSYVLVHFIFTAIVYWFVGRSGPVRAFDLFRVIITFGTAALLGLIASLAFRYWQHPANPLLGLLACTSIIVLTTLSALALIPSGRRALRDVIKAVELLFRPADKVIPATGNSIP